MMKNLIPIDLSLTILFGQIYGYNEGYCDFKENGNIADFKKWYKKLLNTIKKSIKINIIICDDLHKENLYKNIDEAQLEIQKSKKIEQINNILICFFTRLTFNLLGMEPDYNRCRNDLNLSKFRSIQYVQTTEQRSASTRTGK